MNVYTAQELTNIMQDEGDKELTLRKVRYYAQRGLLPERELVNGKLVYTDTHLSHLRLLRAMKKTGQKLDVIKGSLSAIPQQGIEELSHTHYRYAKDFTENFMERTVEKVNDDIHLTFSNRVNEKTRKEITRQVKHLIDNKGEL